MSNINSNILGSNYYLVSTSGILSELSSILSKLATNKDSKDTFNKDTPTETPSTGTP